MANLALLLLSDAPDPPSEYEPADAILGANYSVPLLWLSLFTAADIVSWPGTVDAASTYAALLGRREECLRRSRDRVSTWTRRWPRSFENLGKLWLDFIEARPGHFVAVWTEELAEMYRTTDEWQRTLHYYLEGVDEPQGEAFLNVLAQSYLAVDETNDELVATTEDALGQLAGGYSWAVSPPWE